MIVGAIRVAVFIAVAFVVGCFVLFDGINRAVDRGDSLMLFA